jgi:hypothetical protein
MDHKTLLSETNHMRKLMGLSLLKEQVTSKNILNERELEPVNVNKRDQKGPMEYIFLFPEGNGNNPYEYKKKEYFAPEMDSDGMTSDGKFDVYQFVSSSRNIIVDQISNFLSRPEIKNTILKFIASKFKGQLKGFIKIGSSTSSSGGESENYKVGSERLNYVRKIVEDALSKVGFKDTRILDLINDKTKSTYDYSDLSQHMDPKKVEQDAGERMASISISDISTQGLETDEITGVEHEIETAIGWNIAPEVDDIVSALMKLKTYSDIVDLDNRFEGGLQKTINDSIVDWFGPNSDKYLEKLARAREFIVKKLNQAAGRSGKVDVAAIADDKITISLNQ